MIPELSEEVFFQNKIIQKSTQNQQQAACPARHFTQLPVLSGEKTAAPIIQMDSTYEPTQLIRSSLSDDQPEENSSEMTESTKRKGPSLFDRLFKTKDKNKDRKKSRKARSESRERERVKNVRATSLPPTSIGGKHLQQTQHPVMKLGPSGQLWFEQGANIISATPIEPNEAVLSNVTRQSPIKLVYARPPEIIVQEVTNLADAIDTLPRIQQTDSKSNEKFQLTKQQPPAITVDDVAEKTMMDILDDAIRQLREESQIPPIYVNENAVPESSPLQSSSETKSKKNSLNSNKKTTKRSPILGQKKRKIPGYASPMAKLKDIHVTRPNFFRKFKRNLNDNSIVIESEPTIQMDDSKRNSDVDSSNQLAEANVPQITIDEVLPDTTTSAENNDEIIATQQQMEEPQILQLSNDDDDDDKLKKKSRLSFRKPKINLPATTARIRSSMKGMRIPRSLRTNKKKDGSLKKNNGQIPTPTTSDSNTDKQNSKISLLKRRPFKRQNRYGQDEQRHSIRQLPRLPDIPESRSSTLGSHLYEGVQGSPQLNQRSSALYGGNSMAIEIPVGVPLDAPYEEFDETPSSTGYSPFHRYPDQDFHPQSITSSEVQMKPPTPPPTAKPLEITLAKLPDSPVFDMKIPQQMTDRMPAYQPPEIIVRIPENHKLKTTTVDNLEQKQTNLDKSVERQSEFLFSKPDVPDIAMMEPEFILPRPGIENHRESPSQQPEMTVLPSLLTMQIKSDDNMDDNTPKTEIHVPYNTAFDSDVGSPELSRTRQQMVAMNEAMREKVDKIKNMAGSFRHSFRTKMKDLIQSAKPKTTDPKIIDTTLKSEFIASQVQETDLDQLTTSKLTTDASTSKTQQEEIPIIYEDPSNIIKALDNLLTESGYQVDKTVDDDDYHHVEDENAEKRSKKFARKFPKFEFTHKPIGQQFNEWTDHHDETERPTFSQKNRERFDQIRNRAQKSLGQFADRLKQQTQQIGERTRASIRATKSPLRSMRKTDLRPQRPPPPSSYNHQSFDDLHFASDSELSPGTGVDSLRRSAKVYQELADAQERLEAYMAPVSRNEPRRPPRRRLNTDESAGQRQPDYMQSLPSLSVTRPKPPRPPPPNRYLTTSCQSMVPCDEEISLGTSTSSLWTHSKPGDSSSGKRKRFPRRQRCPPDQFYKNVRLNYRPKKSYVELLQKSQPFYAMATMQQQKALERSQSTGQLYGRYKPTTVDSLGYPIPPLRRSRTLRSKPPICPTSPVFDNSRANSVFSARSGGGGVQTYLASSDHPFIMDQYETDPPPYLLEGKDFYSPYLQSPPETLKSSQPDLQWSPYTWKVKRCRSFAESLAVDKQRLQSPEMDETLPTRDSNDTIVPSRSTTLQRSATTIANHNYRIDEPTHRIVQPETVQERMFKWLHSTTSLDSWRHRLPKNPIKQQQATSSNNSSSKRPIPPPRPPGPSSSTIMMMNRATSPSSTNQSICSSFYSNQQQSDINNDNYYYYNNNIDAFLADTFGDITPLANTIDSISDHKLQQQQQHQLPSSSLTARSLPPPPVPPRPKLIPSHYVYEARQRNRPPTRDVACDTSENGFEKFCQQQQQQTKILTNANKNGGFLHRTNNKTFNDYERKSQSLDISNDDDITLVENTSHRFYTKEYNGHVPNGSINSDNNNNITIASVYTDARTHQSNTNSHHDQKPSSSIIKPIQQQQQHWSDGNVSDDDDTINDDISSLSSSQYQSVMDHLSTADDSIGYLIQQQTTPIKNDSFLHGYNNNNNSSIVIMPQTTTTATTTSRQQQILSKNISNIDNTATSTTTTTMNEYQSALDNNNQQQQLSSSADFQQQYSSQRSSMHSNHDQQQQQQHFDIDNDDDGNQILNDYDQFQKQFDGLQMVNRMIINSADGDPNDGDETAVAATATTIAIGADGTDEVLITVGGDHSTTSVTINDDLSKDNKNRQVCFPIII